MNELKTSANDSITVSTACHTDTNILTIDRRRRIPTLRMTTVGDRAFPVAAA